MCLLGLLNNWVIAGITCFVVCTYIYIIIKDLFERVEEPAREPHVLDPLMDNIVAAWKAVGGQEIYISRTKQPYIYGSAVDDIPNSLLIQENEGRIIVRYHDFTTHYALSDPKLLAKLTILFQDINNLVKLTDHDTRSVISYKTIMDAIEIRSKRIDPKGYARIAWLFEVRMAHTPRRRS